MNYGNSADQNIAAAGNGLSSERPRPGSRWLFLAWPVRERLADI